ncbi:SUKH-3 domain-containing protein [Streptomyces sp. NPDC002574]|uniref:SUKH-3 domain-containing protein n=1 Tax=Streptomyces sp. NPDC002574 TaxID=3364652 RepID=UPI0036B29CE6
MGGAFEPERLDTATRAMLEHAGWWPERRVDVAGEAREFAAWGLSMHPLACSILEALHGFTVEPVGHDGANFYVDLLDFNPVRAAYREVLTELGDRFGPLDFFPVALMYVDGIYVSASGTTVCQTQWEHWLIAESFEVALDRLICLTGEVQRFTRP